MEYVAHSVRSSLPMWRCWPEALLAQSDCRCAISCTCSKHISVRVKKSTKLTLICNNTETSWKSCVVKHKTLKASARNVTQVIRRDAMRRLSVGSRTGWLPARSLCKPTSLLSSSSSLTILHDPLHTIPHPPAPSCSKKRIFSGPTIERL